jgi:hypothetical protein
LNVDYKEMQVIECNIVTPHKTFNKQFI